MGSEVGQAEEEFIEYNKKRRLNDLEVINLVGQFSKKNMRFITDLKKEGLFIESDKRNMKNKVVAGDGKSQCIVTFDYNNMDVKTKGDKEFCRRIEEKIK